MNPEREDKLFRELMGKSVGQMPFSDFEEKLMSKIYKEESASRSFLKNIKLSWFFFIVGALFGISLCLVVGQMNETIFGLPLQRLLLFAESVFVVLLVSQFDQLFRLTKRARS